MLKLFIEQVSFNGPWKWVLLRGSEQIAQSSRTWKRAGWALRSFVAMQRALSEVQSPVRLVKQKNFQMEMFP